MSKRKEQEQQIEENDLVSYLEEKLGHLKPYWSQITLGICIAILALLGGVFLWNQGQAAEAAKWQMLNIANGNYRRSLDNTSLTDFADQYPDDPAGLWALLYSADAEMRAGLAELGNDRDAGFAKIQKAQGFYKKIVDSNAKKTPLLNRRSTFGLAYAYESNGDFDDAEALYQSIVDSGENPLLEEATRGLARVNKDSPYRNFLVKFKEFVPATAEEAPGARLPKRPDISFPTPAEQPNSGGGDFDGGNSEETSAQTPEENSEQSGDDKTAKEESSDNDGDSGE